MGLKNNSTDLPIGETRTGSDTPSSGTLQHLVGTDIEFPDLNYSASPQVPLSGVTNRAVLVRNISGGALLPGTVCKWGTNAGDVGHNVVQAGDGTIGCGIVDPFLPAAGVADDGIFWLFYGGLCDVESDGGTVLALGEVVVTAASGQVNIQTAAPANETAVMLQVNSVVGLVAEAATNVAGTKFRCKLQFPFR